MMNVSHDRFFIYGRELHAGATCIMSEGLSEMAAHSCVTCAVLSGYTRLAAVNMPDQQSLHASSILSITANMGELQ